MKPGDRIGYIDTIPAKTSFKMVAAGLAPLNAYAIKMPFECSTVASIHQANKLTFSIKLNQRVWNSLDNLDREFDKFLLENSTKLFGASEAEYIKKNPGAISLKRAKRLAPVDPEGRPIHDARLSLRISGRTMEVESVQTAEGPRGSYIGGVTWSPRTTPLTQSATRFSMITGHTEPDEKGATKPIVRDTLPYFDMGSHTRFVGPGDIGTHCLVHYAVIRPAYWTNVGGGFMITLAADHIIFENVEDGAGGSAGGGADEARFMPDGFARDPEESGKPKEAIVPMPPAKRRITFPQLVTTESQGLPEWSHASRATEVQPPQITRNITGGAGAGAGAGDPGVGSSSYRVLSRSATGDASIFGDEGEEDE